MIYGCGESKEPQFNNEERFGNVPQKGKKHRGKYH